MKSELLKRIKEDLKFAMLQEVEDRKKRNNISEWAIGQKNVSRSIISMFPDIGLKPDNASDEDTIKLLKKFINQEKTRQLYIMKYLTEDDVKNISVSQLNKLVTDKIEELGDDLTNIQIEVAKKYLPREVNEEEIIAWIKENIDFTSYKNIVQAMGPITKKFNSIDGNKIRLILINNFS